MNKIFISYSHQDMEWKDRVVRQLRVLEKQGLVEVWEDQGIEGGDEWRKEIEDGLNTAVLAILLISENFLNSNFILDVEVPKLLEHRRKDGLRVIPLFVKPCVWERVAWLAAIQGYPSGGRALSNLTGDQVDTELAELTRKVAGLISRSAVAGSPLPRQPIPPDKIFLFKLPSTDSDLFGREAELAVLDSAWADPHTNLLTLVAWGGVGKTSLVNEWLNRLEPDYYRGAERVYGWSFYSQGTSEDRQVSGDEFLAHALGWFGDPEPAKGSTWEKGARLAGLIRTQRTLLILDGLEPLQYPPGEMQGRLKDQGLQALLKELARGNPGLCIVTTRLPVVDLEHATKSSVKRIDLEELSPEAGAQLLKKLGVKGTQAELHEASRAFQGHALALTLLGSYLAAVHEGEIRRRDLIPHLTDGDAPSAHTRRVMASYEIWLAGTPELEILYLMGLFDRPADGDAIAVLRAQPVIAGLTVKLPKLSPDQWQFAVKHLRDLRLLAAGDAHRPATLDCHPLVREYFGEKLRKDNFKAWQAAHLRLYEYYKKLPAKHLPDTLAEMEPLFAAVAHGCQAGRYQETLDEVYWERILREEEYYSTRKLGAFGSDLAALANFFETPWRQPASGLTVQDQAVVLSWAGFRLRALGRLREAAQPMQAGLAASIGQKVGKEQLKMPVTSANSI
jgi:hypothetical protein